MKYFYALFFFLLISPVATAEVTVLECREMGYGYGSDNDLGKELEDIRGEFGYYANKFNDDSGFPKARAQELLQNLEDTFFTADNYRLIYSQAHQLGYVPNSTFAKFLLSYGGDLFSHDDDDYFDDNPLRLLVVRDYIDDALHRIPDLPHDKISELTRKHDVGFERGWNLNLSDKNLQTVVKLYLSLGARFDFTDEMGGNAIISSSLSWLDYETEYQTVHNMEKSRRELEKFYVVPDEKHRADDIRKPCKQYAGDSEQYYVFYRTPITYWLEEFIKAGYPASMLDTHKLHYPRFMKEASVAEVMDMLTNPNPDTHKIPANINCPYKETCPLTPSINMRDAMGRTPLHIAGEQGNQEVFNALIQIGADESVKDYRGNLAGL